MAARLLGLDGGDFCARRHLANRMRAPLGVLLLTFGSAVTADDVPQYLASVRAGRAVPDDVVSEFQRRYDIIGRSPLIDITREQARDLQQLMESEDGAGSS